jgi:ABC-type multidrug transport system fused ATPase/permease subunit
VLDRGRIVQQGTFRELSAAKGPFAAMLARQVA